MSFSLGFAWRVKEPGVNQAGVCPKIGKGFRTTEVNVGSLFHTHCRRLRQTMPTLRGWGKWPLVHMSAQYFEGVDSVRSEGQSFGFWDLDNYVANLGCWEPHPVLPNDGQFAKQEQESLKYQLVDVFGCPNPTNTKMSFLLLERLLPADNLWSSKLKCWMLEDYMHDAWIYVFRIHTLYAKHILTC